jgi:glyoxylase-like metal-dependent hydrolase (beta-lactamase superfamily II)
MKSHTETTETGLLLKRLVLGVMETNCYVLSCRETREGVLVDPAADPKRILKEAEGLTLRSILVTHCHWDHVGALSKVQETLKIPVAIHEQDAPYLPIPPDSYLEDGQRLSFGHITLKVLHTPGHTPGSTCLLSDHILLSGDTIFPGGPGNTAIPRSDYLSIITSIREKIFTLPGETVIYPGHGLETTVRRERSSPFYGDTPYVG